MKRLILSRLPAIVASLWAPLTGAITVEFAGFVVNRTISGVDYAFFVYMLRGQDGVWRIEGL